jgi:replicative DNA helicase Mcm
MATTADDSTILDDLDAFLRRYYHEEIGTLAQHYPQDQQSLEIDWMDLFQFDPDLVDDFRQTPARVQEYLDEALALYDLPVDVSLDGATVRVTNIPDSQTYDVGAHRADQIGEFVGVTGQVQKRTDIVPRPITATFECQRCGTPTPVPQTGGELQEPHECKGCERQGPFQLDRTRTDWEDYQLVRLQRPPEQVKGGQSPTIDAELTDDLVGDIDPGDRVTIAGQLDVEEGDGAAFEPLLDANSVSVDETDYEDIDIDEHMETIHDIVAGERGDPYDLLVDSIGPDIQGMDQIKLALGLQLFGGPRLEKPDGTHKRGDFHVLLLGDPGTAKSSLLKDVEQKAPRSTYASGKGATAAGLTAAAVSDDFSSQDWSLEAGALVQADKGTACVDEIDKISEDAVASMHEALSHQTVHVNKAGINAHLPTRTALLAAGNPEFGRFRQDRSIAEQIDLGPTLLSRFDLMFMIDDAPDPERDAKIIEGMIESARAAAHYTEHGDRAETERIEPAVDTEVLRAWVAHAKQSTVPTIEDAAVAQELKEAFHGLRQANGGTDEDSPVPVTHRKLEAHRRIAQASARVRLSDTVEMQDIDRAKELIGRSLQDVGMDPHTGQFDADIVTTGEPQSQKDRIEWVYDYIVAEEGADPVGHETIVETGEETGIDRGDVEYAIEKLKTKGELYEPQTDHYRTS